MKKRTLTILTLAVFAAANIVFTSCTEKEEPTPIVDEEQGEDGHWTTGVNPYGISVNPYNGDIIVFTDGDYSANGDCLVFTNNLKVRMGALELSMMPSKAAALDANRLLVLNEGNWGGNNGGVSLVDVSSGTATVDWFADNNGRGLGDVAQDLIIYGGKAYATASFSNSIEAINTSNGVSTRIATSDAGVATPRYIAAYDGNIYVSCYSPASVIRIDTASKSITGRCALGNFNPEGVCALNGKLYVASSNISDENYNYSYDNKLYVVDIATFAVTDSITVGYNPNKVKVVDNNRIAVNCLGDYVSDAGGTFIVDPATKSSESLSVNLYNFDVYNGNIYGYTNPYGTLKFYKINANSLNAEEILAPKSK